MQYETKLFSPATCPLVLLLWDSKSYKFIGQIIPAFYPTA